ncbi:phage baseplate assembly protein V [Sporomusa sphaeroides DSM 2875]|uniref:phage baseplate assembly protein V n=1 Tax=Sporomusa sphaeroides TaxID=47679 RepID=UPI00202EEEA1|nr:phage baseplate assembly protein V [Sporomusa sphaeroides]MCM0757341.1 phage baseplate assembly protein V [Sporomusa sphaeroides DSM 2875]
MENTKELINLFKTIIKQAFPDLNGYHFPIRAKVVKVREAGGRVGAYKKLYSVDVQPLKPDGSIDTDSPVIPDVEISPIWAGPQRGIFCLPVVGAIVRVAFYYNDPSYPFVDAVLADGFEIPDHVLDSLIIQHSSGIRLEFTKDKKIVLVEGNHPVAFADIVKQIYDSHTHPCSCGGTGAPNQKMTGHASPKVFTG